MNYGLCNFRGMGNRFLSSKRKIPWPNFHVISQQYIFSFLLYISRYTLCCLTWNILEDQNFCHLLGLQVKNIWPRLVPSDYLPVKQRSYFDAYLRHPAYNTLQPLSNDPTRILVYPNVGARGIQIFYASFSFLELLHEFCLSIQHYTYFLTFLVVMAVRGSSWMLILHFINFLSHFCHADFPKAIS